MEQQRLRSVPKSFHEGFTLPNGAPEMLHPSSVDNPHQYYQQSDPLHPQVVYHPQFEPSYMQLMDSGNHPMVSKFDRIEAERQLKHTDEVCRMDPVHFLDQARFSPDNSLVPHLPDPELTLEEIPNKPPSSESDNKPVQSSRSKHPKLKQTNGTVPRFRPTDEQKRLLENHFHSGHTKPTRELFDAVQQAGDATEWQITVWLKNRRSREKRSSKIIPKHKLPEQELRPFHHLCLEGPEQVCPLLTSRMTHWLQPMEDYTNVLHSVFNELDLILKNIDRQELRFLCRSLMNASQIVCHAMGKEGQIMNKFASDLNTLGFRATSLNDISTLPVSSEDVFIVSAGPNCYSAVSSLCLEAIRMGACVVAFTAHRTADTLFTDCFIRIPGQILTPVSVGHQELTLSSPDLLSFLPDGKESVMNLGSSYEVGLSLVHASVLAMLKQRLEKSILFR